MAKQQKSSRSLKKKLKKQEQKEKEGKKKSIVEKVVRKATEHLIEAQTFEDAPGMPQPLAESEIEVAVRREEREPETLAEVVRTAPAEEEESPVKYSSLEEEEEAYKKKYETEPIPHELKEEEGGYISTEEFMRRERLVHPELIREEERRDVRTQYKKRR